MRQIIKLNLIISYSGSRNQKLLVFNNAYEDGVYFLKLYNRYYTEKLKGLQ